MKWTLSMSACRRIITEPTSTVLMKKVNLLLSCVTICAALLAPDASAAPRDAATWVANLSDAYSTHWNLTYQTASNIDLKLDVYAPRGLSAPNPVLIYYHGGGWGGGSREFAVLRLMPYLEMGFTVVNVEYRGARVALAPAAVEDCRCALLWVMRNAKQYNFDIDRIVLTGDSAGSHLALMSGMLTASAGLDRICPSASVPVPGEPAAEPKVAAIVSWFGATDVGDLLEGENAVGFAIAWMGSQSDRAAIARRVSPLTYARPGAPAVLTIHGDADQVVPLNHATRLHVELTKHGVVNQLITVPGGGHGGFSRQENERLYVAIREFLGKRNLLPVESESIHIGASGAVPRFPTQPPARDDARPTTFAPPPSSFLFSRPEGTLRWEIRWIRQDNQRGSSSSELSRWLWLSRSSSGSAGKPGHTSRPSYLVFRIWGSGLRSCSSHSTQWQRLPLFRVPC